MSELGITFSIFDWSQSGFMDGHYVTALNSSHIISLYKKDVVIFFLFF